MCCSLLYGVQCLSPFVDDMSDNINWNYMYPFGSSLTRMSFRTLVYSAFFLIQTDYCRALDSDNCRYHESVVGETYECCLLVC